METFDLNAQLLAAVAANPVPTPGPREADLLRLLRNVRAREGARGHLTLVDGTTAELQAFPKGTDACAGWARMFRLTDPVAGTLFFGGGDWINQKAALAWARGLDASDAQMRARKVEG